MFVSLAHAVCLSKIKLEKAQLNKIRHIYSNEAFIIWNLVRTTRFWNNFHRVCSKPKYLKVFRSKKIIGTIQNRLRSPIPEGGEPQY